MFNFVFSKCLTKATNITKCLPKDQAIKNGQPLKKCSMRFRVKALIYKSSSLVRHYNHAPYRSKLSLRNNRKERIYFAHFLSKWVKRSRTIAIILHYKQLECANFRRRKSRIESVLPFSFAKIICSTRKARIK